MNKRVATVFFLLCVTVLILPVYAVITDFAAGGDTANADARAAATKEVNATATSKVNAVVTDEVNTVATSKVNAGVSDPRAAQRAAEMADAALMRDAGRGELTSESTGNAGNAGRDLPPENIVISINAVGDCTIGYDETFGYQGRFDQVYEDVGGDPSYFFSNVKEIFDGGDLTVANLENVFTESTQKADKAFRFKAPPEYVKILEAGGIDAVNIANNHIYDYFQKGFDDTVVTLDASAVGYFGYDVNKIIEVKGVKVGLAGFHIGAGGWSHRQEAVDAALKTLNAEADIVVMSLHWGVEGRYEPTGDQRSLARYCIDNGADLVLGHHPHTLQGVEVYEGRTIAYSLGNFCFGGNRNPKDKDTVILRQSFEFDGESLELLESPEPMIFPASVSSERGRNDYRPTPVEGEDAERVLKKIADGV